jgi:hypothetical protein
VSHNPLELELANAQAALAQLRARHLELDEDLRWHARFDLEKNSADLRAVTDRHTVLRARADESQSRLDEAENVLHDRRADAAWGWNPSRWFSERSAAKGRFAEQQTVVDRLAAEHRGVKEQLDEVDGRKSRLERDLRRYAAVDAAAGPARLAQLDGEIAAQESTVADLARRKERVDQRLTPLLAQLADREREAARLDGLLRMAESFQHDLDVARDGYQRKQVHQRCERQLGRSSPGGVIHEVGQQRRALDRDVEKLQRRIAEEARLGSRDVRAVVIDGNNMCFEGSQFIGLTALIPVSQVLSRAHEVTVVFDPSIQTRWRLSEGELTSSLPAVRVHVVKSRRAADELILDVARDPYAVVLSNDRYGEFRDKDAVRNGRVVRHDILKGRVSVPDLEIDEPLAVPR